VETLLLNGTLQLSLIVHIASAAAILLLTWRRVLPRWWRAIAALLARWWAAL
jgi:hypothetical protein